MSSTNPIAQRSADKAPETAEMSTEVECTTEGKTEAANEKSSESEEARLARMKEKLRENKGDGIKSAGRSFMEP
jgi:hypothetical protein